MINVLAIAPYQFLPARMGGQRAIALLYKYLAPRVQLTCISTRNNEVSEATGYQLKTKLTTSPLRYINPFYFFSLRSLIRKQQITHLMIEHPYFGWLGVLLQFFTKTPLIIRSHNIESLRWKGLGKWWWKILWHYERWVHRKAALSLFITPSDAAYAISQYGVAPERTMIVTYGIEWQQPPSPEEKKAARQELLETHQIPPENLILLFNGAFNYPPNLNGLQNIIQHIHPLLTDSGIPFTILICGKDIPAELVSDPPAHLIPVGFVNDINIYFKGSDIFLNPTTTGGGIKTKLVEALGNDLPAVSTQHGAEGIDPAICNGRLLVAPDHNWQQFTALIRQLAAEKSAIGQSFFQHFYWGNIAAEVSTALSTLH